MKTIITICVFAFTLSFSSNAIAQDQQPSPQAIAKEKTHAIYQQLELDGKQQGLVWRAFLQQEISYRERINGGDLTASEITESKEKIDAAFLKTMKDVLSEEQLKKFMALQEKK